MNRAKIVIGCLLLIGAFLWLAYQGYGRAKTYYLTVQELMERPGLSIGRSLRVGGDVKPGSLQKGESLRFELVQGQWTLQVVYTGTEPVPDTFNEHAQAVVDGHYDANSKIFMADKIQAKCASKYESKGPRTVKSFQPPSTSPDPSIEPVHKMQNAKQKNGAK